MCTVNYKVIEVDNSTQYKVNTTAYIFIKDTCFSVDLTYFFTFEEILKSGLNISDYVHNYLNSKRNTYWNAKKNSFLQQYFKRNNESILNPNSIEYSEQIIIR